MMGAISIFFLTALSLSPDALAFAPSSSSSVSARRGGVRSTTVLRAATDDEDASAREMASQQAKATRSALAPDASLPLLDALDEVIASGGSKTEVGAAMYRMLCYQTIYVRQEEVDGAVQLVPDEAGASLDPTNPAVKQQMGYLYQYGFQMFATGLLNEETLPALVQTELCDRLDMSGEAFESWLGVTA